jgi:hypothetical protein
MCHRNFINRPLSSPWHLFAPPPYFAPPLSLSLSPVSDRLRNNRSGEKPRFSLFSPLPASDCRVPKAQVVRDSLSPPILQTCGFRTKLVIFALTRIDFMARLEVCDVDVIETVHPGAIQKKKKRSSTVVARSQKSADPSFGFSSLSLCSSPTLFVTHLFFWFVDLDAPVRIGFRPDMTTVASLSLVCTFFCAPLGCFASHTHTLSLSLVARINKLLRLDRIKRESPSEEFDIEQRRPQP